MWRVFLVILFVSVSGCDEYDCGRYRCRQLRDFFLGSIAAPLSKSELKNQPLRKPAVIRRKQAFQTLPNFAGRWNVSLNWDRGSCPDAPFRVDTAVEARQVGQRIALIIPNFGTVLGRVSRRGFSARGGFVPLETLCLTNSRITATTASFADPTQAEIRATLNLECLSGLDCSVRYSGRLSR